MNKDVEKIRAEVERLRQKVINGATSGQYSSETIKEKNQLLVSLLSFIDSMQEEPKKCMYSKDDYTDEDRKVLCDGCEEECKYSHSVNVPFDSKNYELIEATYYIPKGMCAIIEDDKVIIKKK